MIHLCAARVDGIFGSVSLIEYLLAYSMVLWNHQTILELENAFLIHTKIVDFRAPSVNLLLMCATPASIL
jgi:hypothetical protein